MAAEKAARSVLALDATGDACSVAVLTASGSLVLRREEMRRGHAERLFPLIEEALDQSSMPLSAVDMIAAVRGPGSFTGVRVGVAAARGLAAATGAKAVGVDGFSAIAAAAHASGLSADRAAVLFGRPPRLLARIFRFDDSGYSPLDPPFELDLGGDLSELVGSARLLGASLLGPGAEATAPLLTAAGWRGEVVSGSSAIDVAFAARLAAASEPSVDGPVGAPSPFYLRPPDAEPGREPRPRRLGARLA